MTNVLNKLLNTYNYIYYKNIRKTPNVNDIDYFLVKAKILFLEQAEHFI